MDMSEVDKDMAIRVAVQARIPGGGKLLRLKSGQCKSAVSASYRPPVAGDRWGVPSNG
jgi:hypothetical protein